MNEKVRENRLRRWASRLGLVLRKGRARHWNIDDHGGYMLVDAYQNYIVAGSRFDLTLDAVESWLAETEEEQKAARV
jgi:hypothetical protein